jgi:hypothetical protein
MSRRTRASLAGLSGALLLAVALAGCASGGTVSSTPDPSASGPQEVGVDAAWLDGGAAVAILTEGSSTCLPTADDVSYADGVLNVTLLDVSADTACTRDLVLRGIPVTLPAGVGSTDDLRIEVTGDGYAGEVDLPGVEGLVPGGGADEGTPSAGWSTASGTFALLTYGSSSCRPQVQDATVSGPGQIAVTFATPPADQVCTADFAPRVTVVTVPDLDGGDSFTATLAGDTYDGTSVPIAGVPAS